MNDTTQTPLESSTQNTVWRDPEPRNTQGSSKTIPASIMISGILIAGAIVYSNYGKGPSPSAQAPAPSGTAAAGAAAITDELLTDAKDPILGNPQAPVTIVEFSDFQCPFCKRFFDTAERQIIDTYVKTGKAKLIYRDVPLDEIHKSARPAAIAAQCAHAQGQFWKYHDILFARQAQLTSLDYTGLARELGLNAAQFSSCLNNKSVADAVENDFQEGIKLGVRGTPAFFVNKQEISGAQPFSAFQQIIDAELK